MNEKPTHVKLSGASSEACLAVLLVFVLFWANSGWYRVDCALGVQKACELIAAEKGYTK